MANKTFQGRIVQKHDIEANWKKATNFVPLKGEIIIYDDLNKIKIGDGSTKINDLKFSLAESDLYICTVTASGTSYTADKTPIELLTASNTGKIVVARLNNAVYFFAGGNAQLAMFTRVQGVKAYTLRVTIAGTAALETITLQEYALITDLEANKDNDTSYPSAKAVYTKLQNYLPLTGGTMTGDINTSNNNINNIKSLSFKDKLNENETPLYGYIINNAGRLETAGMRPDGDYTLMFDTYTSDEPEALIEHLRSEGESMPIITLRNIAEPLTRYDAANKKYVDDQMAANSGSTTIITWSDDGT